VIVSVAAFAVICITSSTVYIFNDLLDIEKDRSHPRKRNRPLASGALKKGEAAALMLVLLPAAVYTGFSVNYSFGLIIMLYLMNNLLYTLYVKHMVILDVMSIALGFILRVTGGAVAIKVAISPWLLLCTLLLSLFLGFSKRRNELVILQGDAQSHRAILEHYSPGFIDNMLAIVTASTVISYSMYTFFAYEDKYLMITILFVLYGIFRYQYLIYSRNMGESPEELVLTDKPLLLNLILWIIASIAILYWH
jgi:4-hydroxybenzoate polyprenyltransferase